MLPQPDAEVLRTNPQFAALWKDLATNKIQRNGVSREIAEAKEAMFRREALRNKRVELAKDQVLSDAVRWAAFDEESRLDVDLRETAQIVSAQLDGKLSPQDKDIVQVEVEEFMSKIDAIRTAVESHMEQNVMLLCQVLDPTQQTSTDPSSLPSQIQTLQASVEDAKWQLGTKRIELASTLTQLLKMNAQLLQTAIRTLEQVVHGSVGRHTRARAEHLATVARGLEKRLLVARKTVAGQVYDARAEEQLRSKREELEGRSTALRRRLRDREQWLERLEGVGGLREAVEEMERMKSEIDRVRDEVERLERGG